MAPAGAAGHDSVTLQDKSFLEEVGWGWLLCLGVVPQTRAQATVLPFNTHSPAMLIVIASSPRQFTT